MPTVHQIREKSKHPVVTRSRERKSRRRRRHRLGFYCRRRRRRRRRAFQLFRTSTYKKSSTLTSD